MEERPTKSLTREGRGEFPLPQAGQPVIANEQVGGKRGSEEK